jgi:hypothetical protein
MILLIEHVFKRGRIVGSDAATLLKHALTHVQWTVKLIATVWLLTSPMLFSACASAPKSAALPMPCGRTPINAVDMEPFGFTITPGKIVVVRLFTTACPLCKTDLEKIGALFKAKTWDPDQVQLLLLAYHKHDETKLTFNNFIKEQFESYGIPKQSVQLQFVDQPYATLVKSKTKSSQILFDEWKGLPFGLVFGKDGHLAFRGHFTMSEQAENAHYRFVTDLQKENCETQI